MHIDSWDDAVGRQMEPRVIWVGWLVGWFQPATTLLLPIMPPAGPASIYLFSGQVLVYIYIYIIWKENFEVLVDGSLPRQLIPIEKRRGRAEYPPTYNDSGRSVLSQFNDSISFGRWRRVWSLMTRIVGAIPANQSEIDNSSWSCVFLFVAMQVDCQCRC